MIAASPSSQKKQFEPWVRTQACLSKGCFVKIKVIRLTPTLGVSNLYILLCLLGVSRFEQNCYVCQNEKLHHVRTLCHQNTVPSILLSEALVNICKAYGFKHTRCQVPRGEISVRENDLSQPDHVQECVCCWNKIMWALSHGGHRSSDDS